MTFAGCAKIEAPPGGPVDTKGPTPVTTTPQAGETKVPTNIRMEILFDSRLLKVDPTVVSLSPFPYAGLHVFSKGRRLIVEPLEPLLKDCTYRLTISSQLRNERSNPMAEPIELVFRGIVSRPEL